MNITINGEKKTPGPEALTVSELLKDQKVDMPDMVSVEVNGDIIDRNAFDTTPINEGDDINFLYFMGGG